MNLKQVLKTFKGGIHPEENKSLTESCPFEEIPIPKLIVLPLTQHIGKPAKPLVNKKEIVKKGQMVAEFDGFISAPIHSPVNGVVKDIHREPTVLGFPKDSIIIETNQETGNLFYESLNDDKISGEEIRERVKMAGIVGQGGAAFPTHVKLTPPKEGKIDKVIINACECEPYLTRDYRLILERTDDLISGLKLIMKSLDVQDGVIGIEDNKPKAIEILSKKLFNQKNIKVETLKTKYPQGAEKMLIKAVTGKEVPPGKLPIDVGVVIQNVGTAIAINDAVTKGEPQITAALTVSGRGINQPKNLIVPVGTPLKDVLDYCGGIKNEATKIIVGGPMMGIAQYNLNSPVMKATSGILVLTEEEVNQFEETNCLKCGKCIEVCPLGLMPTKLARLSQLNKIEESEKYGVTVCMECGTCTYTCPANIQLVQWIRLAKQQVLKIQRERKSA